jgi:hypothetical protein
MGITTESAGFGARLQGSGSLFGPLFGLVIARGPASKAAAELGGRPAIPALALYGQAEGVCQALQ